MKAKLYLLLLLSLSLISFTNACDSNGNGCQTGLLYPDGSSMNLVNMKTYVKIKGYLAYVEHYQTYENKYDYETDMMYYYTKEESTVISKFQAYTDNKEITTIVMDKTDAQEVALDSSARLLTGSSSSSSYSTSYSSRLVKVYCGKVEAYKTVTIKITLVIPIKLLCNQFYAFSMLSTLKYYDFESKSMKDSGDYEYTPLYKAKAKYWDIKIDVYSKYRYLTLKNPTHDISPQLIKKGDYYIASYEAKIDYKKDFVIYWKYQNMYEPEVYVNKHPIYKNDYSMSINLVPQLNNYDYKAVSKYIEKGDSYSQIAKYYSEKESKYVKGEYIFIIDCTYYMSKTKMEEVKTAMIKYIQKMPKNCYFNIIIYGDKLYRYNEVSVKYSESTVKKVTSWMEKRVQVYKGEYDMYKAVSYATSMKVKKDYPRNIYCLTSGYSEKMDYVIDQVYKYKYQAKFYTIGLGEYESTYMLEGMGKASGKGYQIVKKDEDVYTKISNVMSTSMSYYISDTQYSCKCYDNSNKKVYETDEKDGTYYRDEAYSKVLQIKSSKKIKYCSVSLKYYNSYTKKTVTKSYKVDFDKDYDVNDMYHHYGYSQMADKYTYEAKAAQSSTYKKELKTKVTQWSQKYQVYSSYSVYVSASKKISYESSKEDDKKQEKSFLSAASEDKSTKEETQNKMPEYDDAPINPKEYEPMPESIEHDALYEKEEEEEKKDNYEDYEEEEEQKDEKKEYEEKKEEEDYYEEDKDEYKEEKKDDYKDDKKEDYDDYDNSYDDDYKEDKKEDDYEPQPEPYY